LLSACKPVAESASSKVSPVVVEPVGQTGISKLTLTARAVERLGITTTPIAETTVAAGKRKVVPYAAVIYDSRGATWAFTNPEPLVFVREAITVDQISGEVAYLRAGPAAGTKVVTVGASELYGAELGVGA
jgi:hypothetical protein